MDGQTAIKVKPFGKYLFNQHNIFKYKCKPTFFICCNFACDIDLEMVLLKKHIFDWHKMFGGTFFKTIDEKYC